MIQWIATSLAMALLSRSLDAVVADSTAVNATGCSLLQDQASECASLFRRCGGSFHDGPTCCKEGATCEVLSSFTSRCLPVDDEDFTTETSTDENGVVTTRSTSNDGSTMFISSSSGSAPTDPTPTTPTTPAAPAAPAEQSDPVSGTTGSQARVSVSSNGGGVTFVSSSSTGGASATTRITRNGVVVERTVFASNGLTVTRENGDQFMSKLKVEGGPSAVVRFNCNGIEGLAASERFFEFVDDSGTLCAGAECTVTFESGESQDVTVTGEQLGNHC